MLDSGLYIAVFWLNENTPIQVGRLGDIYFKSGYYFYVGTAQRNLSARLERHNRREKILRWHIDYLSSKAKMLGAITIDGPKKRECELSKEMSQLLESIPRFGVSDCKCKSHLFFTDSLDNICHTVSS